MLSKKPVKNLCKNCKFYVPYFHKGQELEKFSKCSKFMKNNDVTMLVYSNIMRSVDFHCGPNGKHFVKAVKPSVDL